LAVQGQSVVMGRMAEELQVYDCYSACSVRHANKEESHPDQSHPILIRAIPSWSEPSHPDQSHPILIRAQVCHITSEAYQRAFQPFSLALLLAYGSGNNQVLSLWGTALCMASFIVEQCCTVHHGSSICFWLVHVQVVAVWGIGCQAPCLSFLFFLFLFYLAVLGFKLRAPH
jgi:hypothetical protein